MPKGKGRRSQRRPNNEPSYAMSVPRSFSFSKAAGFPKKLQFRHRYHVGGAVTTNTGGFSTKTISVNSLYDPDSSLLGGQVVYFDQLTPIYNHYTVFAARYVVKMIAQEGTGATAVLYIDDDLNVASTFNQACEQPSASMALLTSQNAGNVVTLRKSWRAKDHFGGDIFDNDDLQGSGTASPQEQMYFVLGISGPFDSSGQRLAATVSWEIEVIYDAVWDELKTITRS